MNADGGAPGESGEAILQETGRHAMDWLGRRNVELQRRVEALEHEVATLESLIATVAHELAEPLVVAETCMISLQDAPAETFDDEMRDRLAVVGRVAARGRVLIETLLADARTADQGIAARKVDSATILSDVLELLGAWIRARGAGVTVGPLPTLEADPGLLSVVFRNLVSNALNYGPRDSGRISIAADREDGVWRFRVKSSGTPLRPQDIERIFRPFERIPGERRSRGAGLGLYICRRIVERHGGRIGATPEQGVGNTFWFTLPA